MSQQGLIQQDFKQLQIYCIILLLANHLCLCLACYWELEGNNLPSNKIHWLDQFNWCRFLILLLHVDLGSISFSKTKLLTLVESFCEPYMMASSDLPGMFSTILLGVKVSQQCYPLQCFLVQMALVCCCAVGTPVILASSFEFWDGKKNSVPYVWEVILTMFLLRVGC